MSREDRQPVSEGERLMRAIVDAFNRRSDDIGHLTAPDSEFQDYPGMPGAAWHRGPDAAVAWSIKWITAFPDAHIQVYDFRSVGHDRFVYGFRGFGHGRQSGVRTEITGYGVGTVRDRRLSRIELYPSEAEALEAVGLSRRRASRSS